MRILGIASALAVAAFGLSTRTASAADDVLPAGGAAGVEAEPVAADATPSFGDETAGQELVDGEIAVDLRDDATDKDIADLEATYQLALRPNTRWSATHDKMEVADVDPARQGAILDRLSRDPRVEHAEPMALYRATFVPNDPLYAAKQWHLRHIGLESAWKYACGQGVTVAVVDTGIACFDKGPFTRGTDLAGTRCEGGWNFVDDSAEAYDDQGHGTHVAGTIAQTTNNGVGTAGIAFCANLMPIKVLNRQGFGTVANVAEGIRYAADEGAQIINLSLGGPIKSRILEDAVEHALHKGVVIVAAAGNSGRSVGWPAAYPGVVAVSATDPDDKLAWFSSRGPEIALAAPGVAVTQQTVCNGGRDKCEIFGTFNGTSMASPHVAGVAALVESLGVTDAASVRQALAASAHPLGDKELFGAGLLDAARATSRVFWSHLLMRAFALAALGGLVARRIRKTGASVARSPAAGVAALATAIGAAPWLPLVGLSAHAGGAHTLVELLVRPLGEWDLVLLGVGAHEWLLLASALPALALAALGFASARARPFIGGVALGTAALLAQMAWSGDAAFVAGAVVLRLWTAGNALVCLWLARVALESNRRTL